MIRYQEPFQRLQNLTLIQDAREFVTPLTLQVLSKNPVVTGLYDEKESWRPGHIQLADESDLFLVAPATANAIAKMANGIADDALSAIYLATPAPVVMELLDTSVPADVVLHRYASAGVSAGGSHGRT